MKLFLSLLLSLAAFPAWAQATCSATDDAALVKLLTEYDTKTYEQRIEPCLPKIAKTLAEPNHAELRTGFVNFVVNSLSSTDENISYNLARAYAAQPCIMELEFQPYPEEKRKAIVARLDFGWKKVRDESKEPVSKTIDERVKQLVEDPNGLGKDCKTTPTSPAS